jgi:integrase
MNNIILPENTSQIDLDRLLQLGQIANEFASRDVFKEFRAQKSTATLKAHDSDIELFRYFVEQLPVKNSDKNVDSEDDTPKRIELPADMNVNPDSWRYITHGLLKAFRNWMIKNSYAISTANRALSTMRRYAKLAFEAGIIDESEHIRMKLITGYSKKVATKINEKRIEADNMQTRRSKTRPFVNKKGELVNVKTSKKAEPVTLTPEQINQLKNQSWIAPADITPQFYRDQLMMCLFLDHGLRCSELADLKVKDINLDDNLMTFYRRKIDETHTPRS